MDLDGLAFVPSYSGGANGPGRRPRRATVRCIVVHTNEGGAAEPVNGAENLAQYTKQPHPTDYPAYHVIVDNNSAVRTALDTDKVNGAGGLNEDGWHICLYGTAAQSAAQWDDPYSRVEIINAAQLVKQAADRLGIPKVKLTPEQVRDHGRGICGHGDVSKYSASSDGHTDPGPNFPWGHFMELVNAGTPTPEQLAAFYRYLEEADVEHGMAVDTVLNPSQPTQGYTLDRWGGVHPFGGAVPIKAGPYWSGLDIARRVIITDWTKGQGYLLDLNGGLHPLNGAQPLTGTPYWSGGKQVPITEY